MIDKRMRTLIREFKAQQPLGSRNRVRNDLTDMYEMADEDGREKMKDTLEQWLKKNSDKG